MINSELRELKIIENEHICKNLISHIMFFIMFLKQTTAKALICTMEARMCYACFYAKISKSFNKNYKPFSSCRSKTSAILSMHEYCSAKHECQLETVIIRNYQKLS